MQESARTIGGGLVKAITKLSAVAPDPAVKLVMMQSGFAEYLRLTLASGATALGSVE
jgi:hypothetical protein